jgi:AraC family transcriptional regulator of adaptative response/methylated-DNA-[protein]-cysteine methyltransferase
MDDDARWLAVTTRDRGADGRFVYGVLTTGVFCRPSCPSRQALRRNVAFFDDADQARAAGLRPCRRCQPTGPDVAAQQAALVAQACRVIDATTEPPTLQGLADQLAVSRFHLHRVFKAHTGITPRAYAAARRSQRVRTGLAAGAPVTTAIYDAGFGSSSRFYESAADRLGMTATEMRRGGAGLDIRVAVAGCTLGHVLVAATERGVCTIELGDGPDELLDRFGGRFHAAHLLPADSAFQQLVADVVALVDRPGRPSAELPLDVRGTAFQERVWQALREVPPGSTVTYAELAARVGAPDGARAVASACAANRLAVAIPCHRVVRSDGSLAGYRWGVERKAALLERERQEPGGA